MTVLLDTRTGPIVQVDGAGDQPLRQGRLGALIVSDGHGRYFEQASRRAMFNARAIVTAPVIFSTAAGTGGPFLWNGTSTVNAVLLGIGIANTTAATTTNFALGLTGNTGQTSAPTGTTAIDSSGNCYIGGAVPQCNVYRVATPTNAGGFFLPFGHCHLPAALSVDTAMMDWIDLAGMIVVPPGAWVSIAASATATAAVLNMTLLWEEVPIGT
jgi:hypothetical protein